jgi:hypothetical protein
MHYRLTATKQAFELGTIEKIRDAEKGFVVKEADDFKGITFYFTWDRLTEQTYKLTCYCKGFFHVAHENFKNLIEEHPFLVANTVMYRELFTTLYTSEINEKDNDTVYSDFLDFKSTEFFQDHESLAIYISKAINRIGLSLQTKEYEDDSWEIFTE